MAISEDYLAKIRGFEGYHQKPYWDYKQWTSGYGTRASGPDEILSKEEHEQRLNAEVAKAAALVDQFAPSLDAGTRAALTSLTYNAGGKWMDSGLGQAIKAGDLDRARASFLQYTQAGGQHLPGLANRRAAEVGWFGQAGNDPRNTTPSGGGYGVDPDGAKGIAGPIHTADVGDAGVTIPQTQTPASTPLQGSQEGMGLLAGLGGESVGAGDVFKALLGGFSGAAGMKAPEAPAPLKVNRVEARAPQVDLSGLSQAVGRRRFGI